VAGTQSEGGGRRVARCKSAKRQGGGGAIDQLFGCRKDAGSRVIVPDQILNVSVDSFSDSASSTTVCFRQKIALNRYLFIYLSGQQGP